MLLVSPHRIKNRCNTLNSNDSMDDAHDQLPTAVIENHPEVIQNI